MMGTTWTVMGKGDTLADVAKSMGFHPEDKWDEVRTNLHLTGCLICEYDRRRFLSDEFGWVNPNGRIGRFPIGMLFHPIEVLEI